MRTMFMRGALSALVVSSMISVAAAQQQAAPATATPMLALVIDAQRVVNESKAGKSVRQQFDVQRQAFSKEVSQAENNLRTQQQEIERQRSILSPEAFGAKARDFEQRVADLRRGWEQKRETLQYSLNTALAQIEKNIIEIVYQIATERGANMVLQKQHVVLVDKGHEITQETMTRLDQKLPSVAFNLVQPPNGGKSPAPKAGAQGSTQQAPPAKAKQSSGQSKGESQKKQ